MSLILHLSFAESGPPADPPTTDAYARMLFDLLPPGRLWQMVGTLLRDLFEACALELGRFDQRVLDLLDEAVPSLADELLPEYERELELPSTGTVQERQARVVAQTIADQGYRPVDFQTTLATLLGQAPVDVVVIERSVTDAVVIADPREIYRFFIYRNPALPGAYFVASAQLVVDRIKPSHTSGHVIESISFLCDDQFSLCDRDILGV